jgi:heme/copper-type cytochrome/quinol oxidase subunit 3
MSATALPQRTSGSRAAGWWGMVFFIATEATLFALLFASYFYLRFKSGPDWPPPPIEPPSLGLPLVMSGVLLSSSIPMHWAERAAEKGRSTGLRAGLLISFLLGALFLGLQLGIEYPESLKEFTVRSNSYGSLFFVITGLHGAHVLAGLVMNGWNQARAWKGHYRNGDHLHVQTGAMYWHFVDVVWIFVFISLYLVPNL